MLASVVDYLGDDLDERNGRDFVPTEELVDALDVEPTTFGKQMGDLGCRPTRQRTVTDDGNARRVRGYLTADIRKAVSAAQERHERGDTTRDIAGLIDHDE